jgi:hypothetical protein
MRTFKLWIPSGPRGGATSGPGLTRIRTRTVGPLCCVVVALCLLACSSGGDERSDASDTTGKQQSTAKPPADKTASSDTLGKQQAIAKPPADKTASSDATGKQQPTAKPPAGTTAKARSDTTTKPDSGAPAQPDTAAARPPTLGEVLARHTDELKAVSGVVSVDSVACDGGSCIQITVTRRTQKVLSQLPAKIEGYQVVVKERSSGH